MFLKTPLSHFQMWSFVSINSLGDAHFWAPPDSSRKRAETTRLKRHVPSDGLITFFLSSHFPGELCSLCRWPPWRQQTGSPTQIWWRLLHHSLNQTVTCDLCLPVCFRFPLPFPSFSNHSSTHAHSLGYCLCLCLFCLLPFSGTGSA